MVRLAAVLAFLATPGCGWLPASGTTTVASSLESELAASVRDDEVGSFYRARDYQPLWTHGAGLRLESHMLLDLLADAASHGLDPEDYELHRLIGVVAQAQGGSAADLARAELMLSRAFANYVRDLHEPLAPAAMIFTEASMLPPPRDARAVLEAAANAGNLSQHLSDVQRMNPVYEAYRQALTALHAAPGSAEEQLIRANMERARALPADAGARFILVDTASAMLYLYEDGEPRDAMRIIVGEPSQPTPIMAGLIRFVVLNPYWNLPPDLVQRRVAPKVLRHGVAHIERERYEILSDWSAQAYPLDSATLDWEAVAAGRQLLRVRQLPGGGNMMGEIKFMFPNRFGVYLHDTPDKTLFARSDRTLSAGCVRVEDARRLARWLFGGADIQPSSAGPEQRVNLPEPVPVYITYLTAFPTADGISIQRDVYDRDPALLAALADRSADSLSP